MPVRAAQVTERVWAALLGRAGGQQADPDWSREEAAAWALYAPLNASINRPFVFAQIGQSLDGRVATPSGDAADVSGDEGLRHLHRLRALADCVVVGANTAILDDPRLTVRLVEGENPARIVIDPRGRVPDGAAMLAGPERRIAVQSCGRTRGDGIEVIELDGDAGSSPEAIVAALGARGFRRIMIEGGGVTIGRFMDAGLVDRLHVSIAPLIIGAGPSSLTTRPVELLSQARRPASAVYGLGTDIVVDCAFD